MHGASLVGVLGARGRTSARDSEHEERPHPRESSRSLRGFVARRNSFSDRDRNIQIGEFFFDRSRRFPINKGGGRRGSFEILLEIFLVNVIQFSQISISGFLFISRKSLICINQLIFIVK